MAAALASGSSTRITAGSDGVWTRLTPPALGYHQYDRGEPVAPDAPSRAADSGTNSAGALSP